MMEEKMPPKMALPTPRCHHFCSGVRMVCTQCLLDDGHDGQHISVAEIGLNAKGIAVDNAAYNWRQ